MSRSAPTTAVLNVRALLAVLALTGCSKQVERPEILDCEQYLLGKLRFPSTYQRVSIQSVRIEKPNYQSVGIEYDAANAYGTPIRGEQICVYPVKNGNPITNIYIDHDNELEDALAGKGKFAAD